MTTVENKILPQLIYATASLIILIAAGIHLGWPSPSMPILTSKDYPIEITSKEGSYIATTSNIGQILGHLTFSFFLDRIGRKWTLAAAPPLFIISALLIHFSAHSIIMLYLARALGGIAEGGCNIVLPIYICEISEAKIRGLLSGSIMIALSVGVLIINLIGAHNSIETTSLFMLIFPSIFLGVVFLLPESPCFLIMKEDIKGAGKCLQKLRSNIHIDDELKQMQKDVQRQMSETGRMLDLIFIPSNRRATIIVIFVEILQVFSGLPALTMYAQTFFAEATDVVPKEWAAVLMQTLKVIAMFISVSIIDLVGRKLLLQISSMCCFLMLTFLSVYFFLKDYTTIPIDSYSYLALIGMLLFVAFFMLGLGVAAKCLIGELFSASVKAKAVCFANIFTSLSILASTNLYQHMSTTYTVGAPLLLFAVLQFCGFWFCWRFVPETKKKTLEEIQQTLKSS